MENQGGQVTVFVVIGILIVAGVILFFALRNFSGEKQEMIPANEQSVQNYVQDCLDDSLKDVVQKVGIRGGYYEVPENLKEESIETSYHLRNGELNILKNSEIESEISKGLEKEFPDCISDFSNFEGNEIKHSKPTFKTELNNGNIKTELNYKVSIEKGESQTLLKKFNSEVPVKMKTMNKLATELAVMEKRDKKENALCVSCIGEVSSGNNFTIDSFQNGNTTEEFVFMISEYSEKSLTEEDFVYIFALEV